MYTPAPDTASGLAIDRRSCVALVAAAIAVAFLERWWFPAAWGEAGSLTSAFYYGDATRFVDYALAIARGQLYDNGIPYHPPGWPLLLALVMRWSGAGAGGAMPVAAIKLLTAALSALSVGVAARAAGEIAGLGALLAVALLAPFDFGHIVEGTVANSEALYGLLAVTSTWAAWRWLREETTDRLRWAVFAAAAGGAATLVRAEFLLAAVLVVLYALMRRARRIELASAAIVFCAVLAPATVWHWRTLSAFNAAHVGRVAGPLPRFAPITSYGPFNFAMANHEDADGGPNRDHPMLDRCQGETGERLEVGQLDLACPAIYDLYVNGYAIGARWMLANPGAALELIGRKAAYTIGFLAQGFLSDDYGAGVDGVRRRVDLIAPMHAWLIPLRLLLIAVGGAVLWRRRRIALAVIAASLVAFVASTLLFYGYVRLGVAYMPIVYLLEGAGIATIAASVSGRAATRRIAYVIVCLLAILTAYDRFARDTPRALVISGSRSSDGQLLQDETIEIRRP